MYIFVIIIILLHFRFSLYYCTAWLILINMRITAGQWREQHKRARRRIKFQWRMGYLEISCHLKCNWIEHKWIRAQTGHKRASVNNRKKENKSLYSRLQYFIARHGSSIWYITERKLCQILFVTKLNHSLTEFVNETRNQTLLWADQGPHLITRAQDMFFPKPVSHVAATGNVLPLRQAPALAHATSLVFWDSADLNASFSSNTCSMDVVI